MCLIIKIKTSSLRQLKPLNRSLSLKKKTDLPAFNNLLTTVRTFLWHYDNLMTKNKYVIFHLSTATDVNEKVNQFSNSIEILAAWTFLWSKFWGLPESGRMKCSHKPHGQDFSLSHFSVQCLGQKSFKARNTAKINIASIRAFIEQYISTAAYSAV